MAHNTIAVDFDGVIHGYSKGWMDGSIYDPPIKGARDGLRRLLEMGYHVVVYTTRGSLPGEEHRRAEAQEWIRRELGLELEVVNGKPLALAYLDDRAVRFTDWDSAVREIRNVAPLG